MSSSLDFLFNPESVAVVGASPREGSVGRAILENLLSGFKGRVYPVNPKYDEILGLRSYPSVRDLPERPDLVVITVRAELVPRIVEDSGVKGARGVIVVSGGFAESGEEGARLERLIVDIARRYGMRLVGPNCIGVYDAVSGVDTFFIPKTRMRRPPIGNIAVVSQSGAFLTTFMDYIATEGVGIVRAINIGNKADVDEVDLIDYLAGKDDTSVIMLYLEDVKPGRGQHLMEAALRARRMGKRIVFLKGGRTASGARAASSHTAALAGDYRVVSSAASQAGMIETGGPVEFLDAAKALAKGRLPRGRRVGVITHAGGPGVIATDLLVMSGLEVPELPRDVQGMLRSVFPRRVAVRNPVDLTGDASEEDYERALGIVLGSGAIDIGFIIAYIQPPTISKRVGEVILRAQEEHPGIPLVVVTGGSREGEELASELNARGVLAYTRLEGAVAGSRALYLASRSPCSAEWRRAPWRECTPGQKMLEHEALALAERYGLPVPRYCYAASEGDAAECARRLGTRMAAKIVSPLVVHKSDIGGVVLGVEGPEGALSAFKRIRSSYLEHGFPPDGFKGVLFMEMAPPGVEVFVGGKWDKSFGPIVLAGSGGVLVELLRDVAIRVAPLSECEARRMVGSTRVSRLLEGYRGAKGSIDAVVSAVLAVSRMLEREPIAEIDVNPLIVSGPRGYAVDVRIVRCREG